MHINVDVHALNDSGIGFRYEVTRGELLLTRDEEISFEFMEKTRLEYFDLKPLLQENLNDLLKIYCGGSGKKYKKCQIIWDCLLGKMK